MQSPYSIFQDLCLKYKEGINLENYIVDTYGFNVRDKEVMDVLFSAISKEDQGYFYNNEIINIISSAINTLDLNDGSKILDCGCSNGKKIQRIYKNINIKSSIYAFDMCFTSSNIFKEYAVKNHYKNFFIFNADITNIPLLNDSVDLVIASGTVMLNPYNTGEILDELIRVSGNYVLLWDFIYERLSDQEQERHDNRKYAKGILDHLHSLNNINILDIEEHDIDGRTYHLVYIQKKEIDVNSQENIFACPHSLQELKILDDSFMFSGSGLYYPVLNDVPVLKKGKAIFKPEIN